MAFDILNEDENTITVSGPNGPQTIAKQGISPQLLSSFMPGGSSPMTQPGPVPGLNLGTPMNAPASPAPAPNPIGLAPPAAPSPETMATAQTEAPPVFPGATVKDERSPFNRGLDQQQASAKQLGQNAYEAGVSQAAALQGLQDQTNKMEAERKVNQFKREEDEKVYRDKITKASDEAARNLPGKDFWADRGTEAQIGAAIAVGLGALGAGMAGGENQAMKIIDNAIKTDMQKQMQRYESLKDQTAQAKDAYGVMLKAYGDKDSALLGMQEAAYKRAQLKIQTYGAMQGSKDAIDKANMMVGQIDERRGELENKLALNQIKRADDMRESFVPSLGGYATSKEGAAKVNELAGATNSATDGIKKLMAISRIPAKSLDPQTRAEADTIARTTQAALRVPILGPGTVNDKERELIETIVADPTRIFALDANNMKRLETLQTRLQANLVNQGKAYGLGGGQAQATGPQPKIGTPR